MRRYSLKIAYDGTNFSGWQIQKNKRTIQGEIQKAIAKVFKSKSQIMIYGAGRTDSGVHSTGQIAHFDIDTKRNLDTIKKSINSKLDDDCKILMVKRVNDDFHARFDAKSREYVYQCYPGESLLFKNQSWYTKDLNIAKLNFLASFFKGDHDFSSYSKFNPQIKNSVCRIYCCKWIKKRGMIIFKVKSNRFLHHMIRYLVGTMVNILTYNKPHIELLHLLNNPKKKVRLYKAPPQGLILTRVNYV